MTRTKASPPPVTPGLFDSADVYALADQVAKLEKKVAKLTQELAERTKWHENAAKERDRLWHMHVEDPTHPAAKENIRLKREVAQLRQELRVHGPRTESEPWKDLSKSDLTHLLTLCHPDKWSQGQPATALAHEITVHINQMRGRAQA